MSDKTASQNPRSPKGCDENGPAAALLVGHVSIQICSLVAPCRRPILIATPLTDVGKGSAKRANHLLETFAPLLLARKWVEFHEINGHEIVRSLKLTFIDDFLNKTGEHCFVLRCCHRILSFRFCIL